MGRKKRAENMSSATGSHGKVCGRKPEDGRELGGSRGNVPEVKLWSHWFGD